MGLLYVSSTIIKMYRYEWKQFSNSAPALPNNAQPQGQLPNNAAPTPSDSDAPPVTSEDVNTLVNNW